MPALHLLRGLNSSIFRVSSSSSPEFPLSVRKGWEESGGESQGDAIFVATQSGAQTQRQPAKAGCPRPPLRPRRGRRVRGGMGQEGVKGVRDSEGRTAVQTAGHGVVFGGWWGDDTKCCAPPARRRAVTSRGSNQYHTECPPSVVGPRETADDRPPQYEVAPATVRDDDDNVVPTTTTTTTTVAATITATITKTTIRSTSGSSRAPSRWPFLGPIVALPVTWSRLCTLSSRYRFSIGSTIGTPRSSIACAERRFLTMR